MDLWVPSSARPAFQCRICGAQFTEKQRTEYGLHGAACYRAHEAEVRSQSLRVRAPEAYGPDSFDRELQAHLRKAAA
jgi:hypothetical protein